MQDQHSGHESRLTVPTRQRRRPWMVLAGVGVVVVVGLGLRALLTAGEQYTDDAQVEADVVALGPRVGGQVLQVNFQDNQLARKGDVIVELDDSDFAARVRQATAELDSATAQAEAADAQARVVEASATGGLSSAQAQVSGSSLAVSSANAQIAAAEAGVSRARAEQHKAKADLDRAEQLFEAKAISQERLDGARLAAESTAAALKLAEAQAEAARDSRRVAQSRVAEAHGRLSQSSPIDAQIAAAKAGAALAHARVKSAEATLELAKLQLSYTRVVAPEDGLVTRLSARVGQLVQPGQALAQLVPSQTYVVANLKETQIRDIRPGDAVEVEVEAYPGMHFEGRVESLAGGTGSRFSLLPPDNASGNFVKVVQRVPVRIAWAQMPAVQMRAGLSAAVTVTTGTHPAASVASTQP